MPFTTNTLTHFHHPSSRRQRLQRRLRVSSHDVVAVPRRHPQQRLRLLRLLPRQLHFRHARQQERCRTSHVHRLLVPLEHQHAATVTQHLLRNSPSPLPPAGNSPRAASPVAPPPPRTTDTTHAAAPRSPPPRSPSPLDAASPPPSSTTALLAAPSPAETSPSPRPCICFIAVPHTHLGIASPCLRSAASNASPAFSRSATGAAPSSSVACSVSIICFSLHSLTHLLRQPRSRLARRRRPRQIHVALAVAQRTTQRRYNRGKCGAKSVYVAHRRLRHLCPFATTVGASGATPSLAAAPADSVAPASAPSAGPGSPRGRETQEVSRLCSLRQGGRYGAKSTGARSGWTLPAIARWEEKEGMRGIARTEPQFRSAMKLPVKIEEREVRLPAQFPAGSGVSGNRSVYCRDRNLWKRSVSRRS